MKLTPKELKAWTNVDTSARRSPMTWFPPRCWRSVSVHLRDGHPNPWLIGSIFWDNGDNGDSLHSVMSAYCEHYSHRIGNTLGGCSTSRLLGFRPAKDQQIAHLQWKRIRDLGSSKSGQCKKLSTASSLKSFKAQISETNQKWQLVPVNSTQFRMLRKRE